jgi:hypothetical protein
MRTLDDLFERVRADEQTTDASDEPVASRAGRCEATRATPRRPLR